MSEDLHELPGEPEEGRLSPEEARASLEAGPGSMSSSLPHAPIIPPVSESILPEQPVYPPRPEYYAQMPGSVPYGAPVSFPPPAGWSPVQSAPVFPFPHGSFPYESRFDPIQPSQPLPLGQAIRELPRQYKKILFKPGVRSFMEEQGKATWGIIWLQLLFQMVIGLVFRVPELFTFSHTSSSAAALSAGFSLVEDIATLILGPALFFAGVGIQYLLARAFKGNGSFKQQAYTQLLFSVPLGLLATVLSTVILGLNNGFTQFTMTSGGTHLGYDTSGFNAGFLIVLLLFDLVIGAVGVYQIVLNVFSLMAVHRMPGGRATACVLIPLAVFSFVVFLVIFVAIFAFIAATVPVAHP